MTKCSINPGGEFELSTSGVVSTAMMLDYETSQYYELVIEVSDSGDPALTTTTTLGITVQGRFSAANLVKQ